MTLLTAWVVFPLVLAVLCAGCGLLLARLTGVELPGSLVLPVGLAVIIVVAQFLTLWDATAELAAPVVVALAVAGLSLGLPTRWPEFEPWAAVAAGVVFAVFAAPIVLSGEATFAGFIKLDDTATWMALTDRVMEHGRNLDGLPPSTYEATLAFNLGSGYPIGVFLPLGIGRELVATDVAWVIQAYMAFTAALLALGLWNVARPLLRPGPLLAVATFLGTQSALLFGYYLWGGIKEVTAAALIATAAGLAAFVIREHLWARTLIPLAVTSAALIGVLSGGGAVWLAPILLATLVVGLWMTGAREGLALAVGFAALTAVLCIPVLVSGGLLPPTSSPLTSATALGNLFHPLNKLQVFGVWLAGDFRADPSDAATTHVLIAAVGAGALGGLYAAFRACAWSLLIYVLGATVASFVIVAIGSPWVEGKAMATAAPAIPFAAAIGGAVLYARGRRVEGAILLAAIATGILWSNALAYRDLSLAPRDQLAELESIGHRIAGEGPTLMTEYEPYGVRHFLRDAEPEGASELRRRRVPLLNGHTVRKGDTADTDMFQLSGLMAYRTLVLRRSPTQSRPPSPFRLIWRGQSYEAWQRPPGPQGTVIRHVGLGNVVDPGGVPRCAVVHRLARAAGPAGALAAVGRRPVLALSLKEMHYPRSWNAAGYESALVPDGSGTIRTRIHLPRAGAYEIWLGGSVRPEVDLTVDGRAAGEVRHVLNNNGEYVMLGRTSLDAGDHLVAIRFDGADLHPGSGGAADPIGPLIVSSQDAADTRVVYRGTDRASELCGRRWDWVEAVASRPGI